MPIVLPVKNAFAALFASAIAALEPEPESSTALPAIEPASTASSSALWIFARCLLAIE